jgi:PAS domain S-box-containing protein
MRMPARRFLALSGVATVAGLLLAVDIEPQPRRPPAVLTIHWGSEDSPSTTAIDAAIKESLSPDPSTPVAYSELFPNGPVVVAATEMLDAPLRSEGPGATGLIGGVGYDSTLALALQLQSGGNVQSPDEIAHQPTRWEGYRRYIVAAVALITLQTVFIVVLLVQRRRLQRAEAALRESEAHFRNLADTVPVMVWRSGVDKKCDFFNQPWLSFTGRTFEQEFGDGWVEGVHPDDRAFCVKAYTAAFDAHQPFRMEYRLRRFDGEYRVVLDSGVPRWEGNGAFAGYIGSCIDISDRKQAERALQETHAELNRVSRLTALGEFAASIAHEVRQPLTAIIINARICLRWLSSGEPDLEEVKAGLLDVVMAGQRAEEVIKRNRELFRHHKVDAAAIDINAVIGEAAALVAARLRDNQITLMTSLAERLPPVMGDRIELQQVLLNLIANAIDAMERVPLESRRIDISSAPTTDQFVQVTITDQGTGLHGVDMERMFTLSYTTKDAGTGVGLSVSRSIVEAHGGRLWAEQNPGRGATFCFTVPAYSSVTVA